MCPGGHSSRSKDRTLWVGYTNFILWWDSQIVKADKALRHHLEMWLPRFLWIPEHSMQTTTPRFRLAQSGLGASQSTQRALPRTWILFSQYSFFLMPFDHLCPQSGYWSLVTEVVSSPTPCFTALIALKKHSIVSNFTMSDIQSKTEFLCMIVHL